MEPVHVVNNGIGRMGSKRVIRGGSWNNNARNVRAAYRNANHPSNRNDNLGFRLARAHRRAGRLTGDPTDVVTVGSRRVPCGEQEVGPGVQVGGAAALANARRWPLLGWWT